MTSVKKDCAHPKLQIEQFFHCKKCLKEVARLEGESPRSYQKISIGLTKEGMLQVWCNWHDCEVAYIALK